MRGGSVRLRGVLTAVATAAFLGAVPASAMAWNVYVANSGSETMSKISSRTQAVVGEPILVGGHPDSVAITPDGRTGYVTVAVGNRIRVFDALSGEVDPAAIVTQLLPNAIAIAPDGLRAYVTAAFSDSAVVLDLTTNEQIGPEFDVGGEVARLAITPDGTTAYMPSGFNQALQVVSTQTNQIVKTIPLTGHTPSHVAVAPDGERAYVTMSNPASVAVIDTDTNEVVGSPIPVSEAESAGAIAIPADGSVAYVAAGTNVFTLDLRSNTFVGSPIEAESYVSEMAITPDGRLLYGTLPLTDAVVAVHLDSWTIVKPRIQVGKEPRGLAIGLTPRRGLRLAIGKKPVRVRRGGRAPLRLTCHGNTGPRCAGRLKLKIRVRNPVHPRRVRVLPLGQRRYSLPVGSSQRIGVRLNRRARKLVNRFGRVRVIAAARASVGGGARRKVVLIRPRRGPVAGIKQPVVRGLRP